MSSLCLRKEVDLRSPVTIASLLPRSEVRSIAPSPHAPSVSTATGTKVWDLASSTYFALLRDSAPAAADPDAIDDWLRCEGARVSGHVKSQTRHLPWEKGIRVAPSGLFPSPRRSLTGSSSAGIFRLRNARAMTSLAMLWRAWRPALRRQASPWRPSGSTDTPQTHLCSRTKRDPSLRPTATRVSSSLRRSPREADGSARSHEPDPFACPARRRALPTMSSAEEMSCEECAHRGSSQFLCREEAPSKSRGGKLEPAPTRHRDMASKNMGSGRTSETRGKNWDSKDDEADTDARKAEGAMKTALWTPRHPHLIGRESWNWSEESRATLTHEVRAWNTASSKSLRDFAKKQGAVRRTYCNFGMSREFLMRNKALRHGRDAWRAVGDSTTKCSHVNPHSIFHSIDV